MNANVSITLPAGINGVTEVGIAAGVDTFVSPGYQVQVVMDAVAGAPSEPTVAEKRALAVVSTINTTVGNADKWAFASNDLQVAGASGIAAVDIKALITDFPGSEADCSVALSAPLLVIKDADYTAWVTTPAYERSHLEVNVGATLKASLNPGISSMGKKLWQGMVAFILANGWIIRRSEACDGLVSYHGPEAHPAGIYSGTEINDIDFYEPNLSATLLASLKVTWFLTNHHVGQREEELSGFIGKVANIQGLRKVNQPALNREIRMVLWSLGKMTSTRGLLSALGVTGIRYANTSNTSDPSGNDYALCGIIRVAASTDIALRAAGAPAGTASLMTYLAIAKTAVSSVYSVCIPRFTSIGWNVTTSTIEGQAITDAASVRLNPAAYHMGAHFLTGSPRVVLDPFTDDEKADLSAYIHATATSSSLAQAAVIVPKSEVVSSIVFTTIAHVRARMATSMGDSMSALLVSRLGGGSLAGGAGVQFGKLTSVQVTDAQELVAAYEAGEVSEDEDEATGGTRADRSAIRTRNSLRADRRTKYRQAAKVLGN